MKNRTQRNFVFLRVLTFVLFVTFVVQTVFVFYGIANVQTEPPAGTFAAA